jgi:hypothetical protein
MKIDSRRSDITATKAQVSAVVRWEESDRLPLEMFFQTASEFPQEHAYDLRGIAVEFLSSALSQGVSRIIIKPDICLQARCRETCSRLCEFRSGE